MRCTGNRDEDPRNTDWLGYNTRGEDGKWMEVVSSGQCVFWTDPAAGPKEGQNLAWVIIIIWKVG